MPRVPRIVALILATGCASQSAPLASSSAIVAAVPIDTRELDGIRYRDITIGTGQELSPRRCVYTHYTGWLADGTRFDSSRDTTTGGKPGEPVAFPQGAKRVFDVELLAIALPLRRDETFASRSAPECPAWRVVKNQR